MQCEILIAKQWLEENRRSVQPHGLAPSETIERKVPGRFHRSRRRSRCDRRFENPAEGGRHRRPSPSRSPGTVPAIAPRTPRPIAGSPLRRLSSPPDVAPAALDGSDSTASATIFATFVASSAWSCVRDAHLSDSGRNDQIDSRSAFAAACRRSLTSVSSRAASSIRSCCASAAGLLAVNAPLLAVGPVAHRPELGFRRRDGASSRRVGEAPARPHLPLSSTRAAPDSTQKPRSSALL